jgi:hypothetical protein
MPGIPSLYFWAGKNPPTHQNGNCWMLFYGSAQQEPIAAELARHPRACAVRCPSLIKLWGIDVATSLDPCVDNPPLVDYVNKRFAMIGRVGGYEFLVPKDRDDVELTYCARLHSRAASTGPRPEWWASVAMPAMEGRTVQGFAIVDLTGGTVIEEGILDAAMDLSVCRDLVIPVTRPEAFQKEPFVVVRLLDPRGGVIASLPFLY